MFHGVIQKITLAQFFLRHGVYSYETEIHYVYTSSKQHREQIVFT